MSECEFRMWSFLSRIFCPNETKSHCKIEQWKIWSASSWPWVNGPRIVSLSLSTGGGSITCEFLMKLFDFSIFGMCCCSIFSCPTCKWWFRMCLPRHFSSEMFFHIGYNWLLTCYELLNELLRNSSDEMIFDIYYKDVAFLWNEYSCVPSDDLAV